MLGDSFQLYIYEFKQSSCFKDHGNGIFFNSSNFRNNFVGTVSG